MDLSLDDIIKKNKGRPGLTKKFIPKNTSPMRKILNRPVFKEGNRIKDARLTIIEKNRAKIVDARDKLTEITRANGGDARQRLMQKQLLNGKLPYRNGRNEGAQHPIAPPGRKVLTHAGLKTKGAQYRSSAVSGGGIPRRPPPSSHLPDVVHVPRGYVDYDNMERMEEEEYAVNSHLSRTVKNDRHYEPYFDVSRSISPLSVPHRRQNSWGSSGGEHFDPFDVYEVPRERHISPERPAPMPLKGILISSGRQQHGSSELFQRRFIGEPTSHLSYEMRSRLERAPDPHASMGIFSNPLKSAPPHNSSGGYRIVVSNLHTSVTQSDIRELFEDIGPLYDSRIVRPGVAEVIYKLLNDAEKAVDTYHNRQLDGQPMKCLMVNPRSSNKPTAPAIKTSSSSSRLTAGKTPLEIDIDALHKVLFRRN